MARSLVNKPNVEPPDSDFPYARLKDDSGSDDGTPVDEEVYGDMHQFFEKLMAEADVTHNELPDNAYSGFQLFEALHKLLGGIKRHRIPIGVWDMDTDSNKIVDFSAYVNDYTKIVGVKVLITSDDGQIKTDLLNHPGVGTIISSGAYFLGEIIGVVDPGEIRLYRDADVLGYNNSSYASAVISRGWIILEEEWDV